MTGLPWSCSAHAKDIWTTPDWEKREKLADCRLAGDLHGGGARSSAGAGAGRARRGPGLSRAGSRAAFGRGDAAAAARRRQSQAPATILSVGRAVPKKGYGDLLAALAALPPGLAWRFVHIGGGPLLPDLKAAGRTARP